MSDVYTDMLGQEIREGDFVVYATTSDRSPVQKYAKVEKVIRETKERRVWNTEDGRYDIKTYEQLKVGVREVKNGRGFTRWDSYEYREYQNGRHERVEKQVRVTYPMVENIVKVGVSGE
jgi:hypothetical protein